MKKTIIFIVAILVVLTLTYFCLPKNTQEKEKFEQYKEDFVLIIEYIRNELNYRENTSVSIIWDEKTHRFISDLKKRTETMNDNPENKLIVYFDSFDEFTEYEQEMLNRVVEAAGGRGGFGTDSNIFSDHKMRKRLKRTFPLPKALLKGTWL